MKRIQQWQFVLLAILMFFAGLSINSALLESLTFDEVVHMQEGINHLTHQTFVVDTNNPPFIRELTAIPLVFGLPKPLSARLVTIFLGELCWFRFSFLLADILEYQLGCYLFSYWHLSQPSLRIAIM